MDLELIKVRDTLQRNIAEKNKRLSTIFGRVLGGNGRSFGNLFSNIINIFARNNFDLVRQINSAVEEYGDNKYSAYNYFDLDTLYAYNRYLEVILSEFDLIKRQLTCGEIDNVLHKAGDYLNANADKSGSNYYNKNKPVGFEYKETNVGKEYSPRRTLSEVEFVKKYNVNSKDAMLDVWDFFSERRNGVKKLRREEIDKDLLNNSETINYRMNDKQLELVVVKKEYFLDKNGSGIVSIMAQCPEGTLYTTRSASGKVYNGPVYDNNGVLKDEVGGEIFYPRAITAGKIQPKSDQQDLQSGVESDCEEYSEEDQMRWF